MSNDKAVLAMQLQAMQVRLGMQTPTVNAMWRNNGVPYHLIDPATGEEP